MKQLIFTKMHGLGNDFVVIDDLESQSPTQLTPELAQKICDRRFGIGADQILWLKKASDPSLAVRMDILNADGSIAEMCGNGIRAVALYLHRYSRNLGRQMGIETLAGVKTVEIRGEDVAVDMGQPVL